MGGEPLLSPGLTQQKTEGADRRTALKRVNQLREGVLPHLPRRRWPESNYDGKRKRRRGQTRKAGTEEALLCIILRTFG